MPWYGSLLPSMDHFANTLENQIDRSLCVWVYDIQGYKASPDLRIYGYFQHYLKLPSDNL